MKKMNFSIVFALTLCSSASFATQPAFNCKNPKSQVEMSFCAHQEFDAKVKEFKTVANELVDAEARDMERAQVTHKQDLIDAYVERTLLATKNLCKATNVITEIGSGHGLFVTSCMIEQIQNQTTALSYMTNSAGVPLLRSAPQH